VTRALADAAVAHAAEPKRGRNAAQPSRKRLGAFSDQELHALRWRFLAAAQRAGAGVDGARLAGLEVIKADGAPIVVSAYAAHAEKANSLAMRWSGVESTWTAMTGTSCEAMPALCALITAPPSRLVSESARASGLGSTKAQPMVSRSRATQQAHDTAGRREGATVPYMRANARSLATAQLMFAAVTPRNLAKLSVCSC